MIDPRSLILDQLRSSTKDSVLILVKSILSTLSFVRIWIDCDIPSAGGQSYMTVFNIRYVVDF